MPYYVSVRVAVTGFDLMTSKVRLKNILGVIITLTCTWMYSVQALSTQAQSVNQRLNFVLNAAENHVVLPDHDAVFRCSDQIMPNVTVQWLKDDATIGTFYHTTTSVNTERRNSRHKKHMRHRSRYVRAAEERLSSWPHSSRSETSLYTSTTKPQSDLNSLPTLPQIHNLISDHRLSDSDSIYTYTVLRNGSLFIHNIKDQHSGEYKCMLHDQHGIILRRKFKVIVAKLPQCSITPSSQSVKVGAAARFQCLTISDLNVTYSWTKNGKSLPRDNERFRFLSIGVLQIIDVSPHDIGTYRCYARSVLGGVESDGSTLSVVPSENADNVNNNVLDFKYRPQNITVFPPKRSAIFECLANQHNVTYGWTRRKLGDKICREFANCPISGGNNLIIDDISKINPGEYVCIVRKLMHQSSGTQLKIESSAFLNIAEKPNVTTKPDLSYAQQLRSTHVRLTCRIEGNPSPDVYWMKDGVILNEEKGYKNSRKVEKLSGSLYLHLSDIQRESAGYYQCIGENHVGAVSTGVLIDILIKEDIPPPLNVTARAISSTQILVEWNRPNTDKNITAYSINLENDEANSQVTRDTYKIVRNLLPYHTYVVKILAYTARDTSHPSEPVTVRTMEDVPSAAVEDIRPEIVNSTTILLSWPSLPRNGQCGIITKYEVSYTGYTDLEQVRNIDAWPQQLPSDEIPVMEYALIPNLTPGENYGMAIRAYTRIGVGPESAFVEATLPEKSRATCSTTGNTSYLYTRTAYTFNNDLKIFWKLKNNVALTSVNVVLKMCGKIVFEKRVLPTVSNLIFSEADPRKAYILGISLVDNFNYICETKTFAVLPPGPRKFVEKILPTNVVASASTPGCINVTWDYNNTREDVLFSVRYQLVKYSSQKQEYSYQNTTNTTLEICGLKPYSEYKLAVAGLYDSNMKTNDSFYAKHKNVRTSEEEPGFPTNLDCFVYEPGKVDCAWSEPLRPNGEILSYTLLYAEIYSNDWASKTSKAAKILLECLKPGQMYAIKVFATNNAGSGQNSTAVAILVENYDMSKTECVFETNNPESDDNSKLQAIGIGVGIGLLCIIICIMLLRFLLPMRCRLCVKHGCKKRTSKHLNVNGTSKTDQTAPKQNGHIVKNGLHKHENDLLEEQRSTLLPTSNNILSNHEKNGNCQKNGFKQHPNKKNGFHKPSASTRIHFYPDDTDKIKYETSSTSPNGRINHQRPKNGFKTFNFGLLLPSSRSDKTMAVPQNDAIQEYSCNQPLVLSHPIPDHISKTTSTTSPITKHGDNLHTSSSPPLCDQQSQP